ncbi:MAG: PQQ-binding-like beta-propeller repeat protein [Bacteroidetes bacterium]|nr:PQQ-binding-like beta-propeller repeat protein [Bacteroidota bacterium]MCW5896613.1 PQQ-binding-like beta-propeller repeat protein [Bacteroidota bacterium]
MTKLLHYTLVVLLFLAIGCGGLRIPPPFKAGNDSWGMFGGTPGRTNVAEQSVQPPLTLAWQHDITSGMGSGSPLVIGNVVLVTNLRGELHGIDAETGKRIGWLNIGDAIKGSPAVDGNVVYIAIANSRESLVAYDLLEGKYLWKKEFGDLEVTPLFLNNRLYFGNTSGVFFCVDKETGEHDWRFRLPDNSTRKGIRSSATVDGALVIFGAEDGSIYALDAKNGAEQWSYNTGASVFAAPAVSNGTLFCGNSTGTFSALNSQTGNVLWQFDAGAPIYATPSFPQHLVLIGTTAGTLYALNVRDGSVAWRTELNSVINSSAVVSGDVAYVGTLKKELYAVQTTTGAILWKETLKGRVKTSPAVAGGKVFVSTDDKLLLAFTSKEQN